MENVYIGFLILIVFYILYLLQKKRHVNIENVMKLYRTDLFGINKFKSILTLLCVFIIIIIILNISLKQYLSTNQNSFIKVVLSAIVNLDANKLFKLISSIFKDIAKDITKIILLEIDVSINSILEMDKLLIKLSSLINLSNLGFLNVFDDLKNSISNTVFPMFNNMFKIKDIFKKISGVLATILFTFLSGVMTNSALLGSIVQIVTSLLAAGLPFILVSFFLNLPLAIALSAVYVAVAVPMVIVATETSNIYRLTSPTQNFSHHKFKKSVKRHNHCFHRNTKLVTNNGIKCISDLTIYDKLKINNEFVRITGLSKHCGKDQVFYNIDGIIVTRFHPMIYKNKWIYPYQHPNAIEENICEKYVYCLNTKNKRIQIKNHLFLDWDEIDEYVEEKIKFSNYEIDYYTNWIDSNTLIRMNDKSNKKIKNIRINDILENNNRVLGIINLGNKQLYSYKINNKNIKGCRNLIYYDGKNKKTTLNITTNQSPYIGLGLQLFTENSKIITDNNITLGDYDSSIHDLIYS